MILNKEETKKILERVIKLCQADSVHVALSGGDEQYVRYANNMISTSLAKTTMNLNVSVAFQNKNGSLSPRAQRPKSSSEQRGEACKR